MTAALWNDILTPVAPSPDAFFDDLPIDEDGTRFDFQQAPWVREVLNWWTDPRVQWIHLIQGSQTSKTTTMQGLMLYAARHDPGPALYVGPIEEEVDKYVTQRLKPFLETADSDTKTGRKSDWRKSDMRIFGRMLVHFAWASSGKKLRSWPARYLFGDEIGVWPESLPRIGEPLAACKKRTRRFRNRKGLFATTPTYETHPSWRTACAADAFHWYVPCPRCGEFQYLSFDRLHFEGARRGEKWEYSKLADCTYYECASCRAHLVDADKPEMIRSGRMQCIDLEHRTPTEPTGQPSRTLQIPSTYSLFTSWSALAQMFLVAKAAGADALRLFTNDEQAEPWREKPADAPTIDRMTQLIDEDRPPGVIPYGTLALTAGVDIQADRLYYVVRAWGPAGRSWLIAHGVLPRDPDGGLTALDELVDNGIGGRTIDMMFIDSGYQPDHVYAYCRVSGRSNVAPSKGLSGTRSDLVKSARVSKDDPTDPLKLYLVNTHHFKKTIHERLRVSRGDPREWRIHAEADDNYRAQIVAEVCVPTVHRGAIEHRWKIIDQAAGNHYLDCECYAMAAAFYPVGIQRMEAGPVKKCTDWFKRMREKR